MTGPKPGPPPGVPAARPVAVGEAGTGLESGVVVPVEFVPLVADALAVLLATQVRFLQNSGLVRRGWHVPRERPEILPFVELAQVVPVLGTVYADRLTGSPPRPRAAG